MDKEYVLKMAKENDVKFIRLWFTDILGSLKGFAITIDELDGTPYKGDPRWALKRALKKAQDLGYTLYVGPELEYFYFKGNDGTEVLDKGGYFDLTPLDVATELRRETILTLEAMGIRVEYSHHEVAPSQHEIDLRYAEALAMVDHAMTYRLVGKEIAFKHGVYATFMPKPIFGQNGSGGDTYQSFFKGDTHAFFL